MMLACFSLVLPLRCQSLEIECGAGKAFGSSDPTHEASQTAHSAGEVVTRERERCFS